MCPLLQVTQVYQALLGARQPSGLVGVFLDPNGNARTRRVRMGGLGDTFYEFSLKVRGCVRVCVRVLEWHFSVVSVCRCVIECLRVPLLP